ncbi:MAG: four helix bundle protein [Prosthecochloris sp.]|nr:four helix bundle protein [Prosthecochloris sp.]
MNSHKDLKVWQTAMDLVEKIYLLTKSFPEEEKYGLTSQLRRAAVSIPSNIAEGAGRNGNREFIQFLYVALGSLAEVETQIDIAKRLCYVQQDLRLQEQQITEIRRMLQGLIKKLRT